MPLAVRLFRGGGRVLPVLPEAVPLRHTLHFGRGNGLTGVHYNAEHLRFALGEDRVLFPALPVLVNLMELDEQQAPFPPVDEQPAQLFDDVFPPLVQAEQGFESRQINQSVAPRRGWSPG